MAIRKDLFQHRAPRRESSSSSIHASSAVASDCDDDKSATKSYSGVDELKVYDVICGRHKAAFNNIGNRRLRVTVSLSQERYSGALTRKDKSTVIKSIADLVRANGGRFLQRIDDTWVELSEKQAHEKVGHALRDMAVSAAMKLEPPSSRSPIASTKYPKSLSRIRSCSQGSLGSLSKLVTEVHCVTSSSGSESARSDSTAAGAEQDAYRPIEEVSLEPLPWKPQDHYEEQPTLDGGILSWLLNESDSIMNDIDN